MAYELLVPLIILLGKATWLSLTYGVLAYLMRFPTS